jgi:hypothetical protein
MQGCAAVHVFTKYISQRFSDEFSRHHFRPSLPGGILGAGVRGSWYSSRQQRGGIIFGRKYLKTFTTLDAAVAFRKEFVETVEQEWQAYLLILPTKDSDGDVATMA